MYKKKQKRYGVFLDPLAERIGRRTRQDADIRLKREAFFAGARRSEGLLGLAVVSILYMVWISIHAVVTESIRTIRGVPRFGKKKMRVDNRGRRSKVETIFHEV